MKWGDRPEARNVLLADQLPVRNRGPSPCILSTGGPIVLHNIHPLLFTRVTADSARMQIHV